jgi:hypothetical protein
MRRDLSFHCGRRPVKFHHAALRRVRLAAAPSRWPLDSLLHSAGPNAHFEYFRQCTQNRMENQS